MINLIIPINKNVESYTQGITKIALNSDAQIYIGITEDLASKLDLNMPNVDITIFEKGSKKEEILLSMQSLLTHQKTIIARRPISLEEFLELKNSKAQITYCSQGKSNKIKSYLNKLWQSLTRLLFGIKTFGGDTSLIAFDKDVVDILAEAENFSFATRVDRWKGFSQNTIEAKAAPVRFERNKKNTAMLLLCAILPFAIAAILTTCLALFAKLSIITGLLLACLDILCLSTTILSLFVLLLNSKIGQKNFKKAQIVNNPLQELELEQKSTVSVERIEEQERSFEEEEQEILAKDQQNKEAFMTMLNEEELPNSSRNKSIAKAKTTRSSQLASKKTSKTSKASSRASSKASTKTSSKSSSKSSTKASKQASTKTSSKTSTQSQKGRKKGE